MAANADSVLLSLPAELLNEILGYLWLPDQAALARTCKALNRILTPVVWSEIELHHRGTHEGVILADYLDTKNGKMEDYHLDKAEYPYAKDVYRWSSRKYAQRDIDWNESGGSGRWGGWGTHLEKREYQMRHLRQHYYETAFYGQERDPVSLYDGEPSSSKAMLPRATQNGNRDRTQYGREEMLIRMVKHTTPERWRVLARCVQSLCMSSGVDEEVIKVLSSMSNLKSLELVGLPLEDGWTCSVTPICLPRLRHLKLRGYFTSAFLREICANATSVTHLNLGLLATPTDDRRFMGVLLQKPELDHDDSPNDDDDDSSSLSIPEVSAGDIIPDYSDEVDPFVRFMHPTNTNLEGRSAFTWRMNKSYSTPEREACDSDNNGSRELDIDPLMFHSPIWLPLALPKRLNALTHLHLTKPYHGETNTWGEVGSIESRYERVVYQEWCLLLRGVAGQLKELICEHRVPVEAGDTVGDGDPGPEDKYANRSWMIEDDLHFGDQMFCKSVLRLLLQGPQMFPRLRYLALRGIRVKGIDPGPIDGFDAGDLDKQDTRLAEIYPDSKVEVLEDVYPIHVYAGWIYGDWPQNRHEAMQDEGDGLLYNSSYFNDYRGRFGTDWRIAD